MLEVTHPDAVDAFCPCPQPEAGLGLLEGISTLSPRCPTGTPPPYLVPGGRKAPRARGCRGRGGGQGVAWPQCRASKGRSQEPPTLQGPGGPRQNEGLGTPALAPTVTVQPSFHSQLNSGENWRDVSLRRKQREEGREASPQALEPSAQNHRLLMATGGAELSLYLPVVLDLESNVYPLLKEVHQHRLCQDGGQDLLE